MTENTSKPTQYAEGSNIAQAQGQGAIANVITNIFRGSTAEQRALRNRQAMLQLVRNTWIKGVLEQSLHGAAMIELGLEERADAVERPWDMVLQTPDQPNRPLPPSTKIVDVFDEMNQALLILGEPGSGKTTMLLELARDTIARAEEDPMQPIPVVFNLSSWTEERQPIAEWLVEELNTKYNIPKKIARPWVENDELLFLLDGLDEVILEHREDCVKAINDFRREHLIPLVVCSRIADYRALTTKLKLQGAVLLQPLTPQQIDEYLGGASTELSAVRETLHNDTALQELAQSPLMLSIMALAYQETSVQDLQSLDATETRRKHLFDAYVQRMFERRRVGQPYSPEQTSHCLVWFAQKMSQHTQTVLLIERIQPIWLQTDAQRLLCVVVPMLSLALIGGLMNAMFLGLLEGVIGGLLGGVIGVLSWGLLGAIMNTQSESVEMLKWSWKQAGNGLVFGLVFGLVSGLAFWLIIPNLVSISRLLFGRSLVRQWDVLTLELIFSLTFALMGALLLGLSGEEIETRTMPNQGIRQSVRNALTLWLIGGLCFGLICGLYGGLIRGLSIGLNLGLGLGLTFGGLAAIKHFTLRFVLYHNGHIPWNLVRFLDYATDRIFLRKVGGGYIFIHRMLQEYFASLAETTTNKDTR